MLRSLTYFAAFFAACLAGWVARHFGEPTVDQAVFHLYYADPATFGMGEVFVVTFLVEAVVAPLALTMAAVWLHRRARNHRDDWRRPVLRALPPLALAAGTAVLLLHFSVFSFVAAHFGPDRFAENFRDPRQVKLAPGKLRNLVLIYVESLETTYSDPAHFGADLLAPLYGLGGHSFPAYRQAPGATWTMAAMVATQCGVPLTVYTSDDLRRRSERRSFLPGATCLGDVLQAHGYRNVFLGGAPLSFAGKGTFLRDHGYAERYGRHEWHGAKAAPGEFGEWGLLDDALLTRAKTRLAQLHASGQPFNLTLLTLDTHNPDGFDSPTCSRQGAVDFEGKVACTARQLAEFVRFAREQGYLENTVVAIIGDHLAGGNPVSDRLEQQPDRRIFNLFIGTDAPPADRRELLSFDLYPSLLDTVGIAVEGGRLGLGVSAWADPVPAALPQDLRALQLPVVAASPAYRQLWKTKPGPDGDDPDEEP